MTYQITAILLLVFFYAVYLGKMAMQRKQGIKTNQIATKNKKGKVYAIELIMKIATYCKSNRSECFYHQKQAFKRKT